MSDHMEITFNIPRHLVFSELCLKEVKDGLVRFEWSPIAEICRESGIDEETVLYGGPVVVPLLVAGWLACLQDHEVDEELKLEWAMIVSRWLQGVLGTDGKNWPRVRVGRVGDSPTFN